MALSFFDDPKNFPKEVVWGISPSPLINLKRRIRSVSKLTTGLYASSDGHALTIWDTNSIIYTINLPVLAFTYAKSHEIIISFVANSPYLHLITPFEPYTVRTHPVPFSNRIISSMYFFPKSSTLVSLGQGLFFTRYSSELVDKQSLHFDKVFTIFDSVFVDQSKELLFLPVNNSIEVYNSDGILLNSIQTEKKISSLTYFPSENMIGVGYPEGVVSIYFFDSDFTNGGGQGERVMRMKFDSGFTFLCFLDRTFLLAVSLNKTIFIIHLPSQKVVQKLDTSIDPSAVRHFDNIVFLFSQMNILPYRINVYTQHTQYLTSLPPTNDNDIGFYLGMSGKQSYREHKSRFDIVKKGGNKVRYEGSIQIDSKKHGKCRAVFTRSGHCRVVTDETTTGFHLGFLNVLFGVHLIRSDLVVLSCVDESVLVDIEQGKVISKSNRIKATAIEEESSDSFLIGTGDGFVERVSIKAFEIILTSRDTGGKHKGNGCRVKEIDICESKQLILSLSEGGDLIVYSYDLFPLYRFSICFMAESARFYSEGIAILALYSLYKIDFTHMGFRAENSKSEIIPISLKMSEKVNKHSRLTQKSTKREKGVIIFTSPKKFAKAKKKVIEAVQSENDYGLVLEDQFEIPKRHFAPPREEPKEIRKVRLRPKVIEQEMPPLLHPPPVEIVEQKSPRKPKTQKEKVFKKKIQKEQKPKKQKKVLKVKVPESPRSKSPRVVKPPIEEKVVKEISKVKAQPAVSQSVKSTKVSFTQEPQPPRIVHRQPIRTEKVTEKIHFTFGAKREEVKKQAHIEEEEQKLLELEPPTETNEAQSNQSSESEVNEEESDDSRLLNMKGVDFVDPYRNWGSIGEVTEEEFRQYMEQTVVFKDNKPKSARGKRKQQNNKKARMSVRVTRTERKSGYSQCFGAVRLSL